MRSVLLGTLLALTLCAAPAHAVVGGAIDDPAGDSTAGPGTDLLRAAWEFDPQAGRWTVSVTFAATPTESDYGVVNAVLRDATAPDCGGEVFATFRGSSRAGNAAAGAGSSADGVQPDGSTGPSYLAGTNVKSDDGRTTTLEASHPRLVGRNAACVLVTISHHGVKDSATIPAPGVPVAPGPPDPANPGRPGAGPYVLPPARANLRLASSRTLRFNRGAARITLSGARSALSGKLSLLAGGRRIAQGKFSVATPVTVKARLFLTRAGASYLRRRRGGRATLVVRTTVAGKTIQQRFRVRLRR